MNRIQLSLLFLLVLQLDQLIWCAPSMFGDGTSLRTTSDEERDYLSRQNDGDYADNSLGRLIRFFGKMGGMLVIPNQKGEPTIIDGDTVSRFFSLNQSSKPAPDVEFKREVSKKQLKKNPRDILRGLAVKRSHFY